MADAFKTISCVDVQTRGPIADIRSFGAKTSASDNSTAIADTLTYVRNQGGGTVLIPSGRFSYATGLNIRGVDANDAAGPPLGKKSVNIIGVSKRDSILKYTGTGEGLYLDTSDSSKHGITTLRGFHLEGTGAEPGSVGLRLGTFSGESSKVVVDDICISKHGLGMELHHHYGSKFYNVQVRFCNNGVQIGSNTETNNFNQNSFHGCEFSWNDNIGLYIFSGDHVVFDNCLIENNGDEGIYAERGANNIPSFYVFRDCWIENNQKDKTAQNKGQVYLHSTVETGYSALDRFTFERCLLEDPGNNYHFEIGNTLNFTLKDCRFSGGGGNDYIFKRKAATESGWCKFESHNSDQINLIRGHTGTPFPGMADYPDSYSGRIYAAAAPTGGTYAVGDVVFNTAPSAGGTMGWVCTAAGSPGTWKTFGAIAA